jgi:predicted transposase YbfD/YdcC
MNNPVMMYFSEVKDPRKGGNVLYPLEEILLNAIVTLLVGGETFEDMEDAGEGWLEEMRKYYPFKRGIPSADTFRYVFKSLDPRVFGKSFANWMRHLHENVEGLIAIDGKSSRGSGKGRSSPISTVSAFCHEHGVVLACIDTEDKSNEIKVLPDLIRMLKLDKAVVSIDAMGCQKAVVEQIIGQKGNYLISLKGNQGRLHDEVRGFYETLQEDYPDYKGAQAEFELDIHEYEEQSKGRHYRRRIVSTSDFCPGMTSFRKEWKGLQSVVMIESWRTHKGETTFERRFAITSLNADSKNLAKIMRSHWSVENNLHWVLDVYFDDDACTVRDRNAAKNLTILKRIAFNILRNHRSNQLKKKSLRRMRFISSMTPSQVHTMLQNAGTQPIF